jgi:predicted exporter
MSRASRLPVLLWLLCILAASWVIARAHYSADLSAFLPAHPDSEQALLVQLLRDGPTSQLMLLSIEGADADTRARLSHELAQRLVREAGFSMVANGEAAAFARDRDLLFKQRYLLSPAVTPERFTIGGLDAAFRDTVSELGPSLGEFGDELLAHDPTGETEQLLDSLDTVSAIRTYQGVWVSADGARALLMARTTAPGSDTDGQQAAIRTIEATFSAIASPAAAGATSARLQLSGPGVFAAEARGNIQREVVRLSVLSTVLIGALLLAVYRSAILLALGFLPVVSGAIAGVAAVALGFEAVFGITLGFGVTLIGEAVDYSVYLFVQSAHSGQPGSDVSSWQRSRWPTVRLGMLTSVCGFAALLPAQFPGLAQLGLYSVAGLIGAALVTRFVLPVLLPAGARLRIPPAVDRRIAGYLRHAHRARAVLWLVALAAILVLALHRAPLWNQELSALSPLPESEQALDGALRADLGAPDVRDLVVVDGASAEAALRGAEAVGAQLDRLVAAGAIGGYESPSRYLPSQALQGARQSSLPDEATLQARVATAARAAGLRPERLAPFLHDVAEARQAPLVRRADLQGTSLATGVDSLLVRLGARWSALLPLRSAATGPQAQHIDADSIAAALKAISIPGIKVSLLDLKSGSNGLYHQYLSGAIRLSCFGLAAIGLLLLLALRSAARTARVLLPLALAAVVVAAIFALQGRAMTILHLIGLLLIFAVGSNYALFFDRRAACADEDADSRVLASLLLANLTTVIGFGVLATSAVPVLSALGTTVAPGAFLALLFSAMMAPQGAPRPEHR